MDLNTPIEKLPRIGPIYAHRLRRLDIKTVGDLLYHVPSRFEDFSLVSKISKIQEGETVTIRGKVIEIKNIYTRRRKIIQKAKIQDETGIIEAIWFNQPFLVKNIHVGDSLSLAGKVKFSQDNLILESPEYEVTNNGNPPIHTGRLIPVYPETRGVSSKWLRRQIYQIISISKQNILEHIPYSILKNNDLMGIKDAIEQVHFPDSIRMAEKARKRLAFDELFLTQLASTLRRSEWESSLKGAAFSIVKFKKNIEEFYRHLPFELTDGQKRAVREIFADIASTRPMNRLLEGDVGSGKTVVAAVAMYLAHLNGFQSMLVAPTQILVNQHYKTISDLLTPFGVKVELITGSKKLSTLNSQLSILVGTHAALSDKINFEKLGLVVIDEQQRFGVRQRSLARRKGKNPHFLTMTATPIPRTVALTLYGDLDLSFLDEMPKDRKPVKTWLVPREKRNSAYNWIRSELITHNSQLFVICPFIEESETLTTVKAATKEYERLKKEIFKDFRVGLLHGKLKSKEKENVLNEFKNQALDILVATPVVEVGIDIPNATIILIEAAERFGLAQLHQLRGRVGRSDRQSYCLLFTESESEQTLERLKAMQNLFVGSQLAELDLRLRGAGEIYGTRQHGKPVFKIATLGDLQFVKKAVQEAQDLFPKLKNFPLLQEKLKNYTITQVEPD